MSVTRLTRLARTVHRVRFGAATVALVALVAASARAQPPTAPPPGGPPPGAPPPEVHAYRIDAPVRIDGVLDEPVWAMARPVTEFTQLDPEEGHPVSERTEVRVLISDDALYVGARLYDRDAAKISRRLSRRDDPIATDEFDVYLDCYHDHLTAKRFRVNPGGAILDGTIGADGSEDDSWDAVWEASATVDSLGWTAEMRIPLSQLRYNARGDGAWGIQLVRTIFRRGETAEFAFTPKKEQGGVSRYGNLTGLGLLPRPRRLELLPYASARNERLQFPADDPFRSGSDYFGATGADARYGLTSDLTLDLTANPDFGQVEVDPAQVNLTAFETFYPEHRPFFVEGSDLFAFGRSRAFNNFTVPTIFNSRRIGRAPERVIDDPGDSYVDSPATTTIAGAAKLTGRTPGGWAVGALDAVTTPEEAKFEDATGAQQSAQVEPLTHYFAGRVRRELRQGNTAIGGLFTAVNRQLDDPTMADLLRSDAYLGGLDLAHAWARRRWALDADATGSFVRGSADAMQLTQQQSDRYLQRPDHAGYYAYDPTRTSMTGYGFDGSLAKSSGTHWLGSVAVVSRSPGYEANDLGFQTRADYTGLSSIVLYQENKPGPVFRNYLMFPYTNEMWNYGGDRVYDSYAFNANGTLRNFWTVSGQVTLNRRVMDDRLTRGGPQAVAPENGSWSATVGSDSRKPWTVSTSFSHSWSQVGDYSDAPSVTIDLRPSPTLHLSFAPTYTASHGLAQYVGTFADPLALATYGNHYVFATLDQRIAEIDTRVDWTMTPKLTLQLYLQPLVVSGHYSQYKELDAPETYDFDVYGVRRGSISRDASGVYTVDPGDGGAFQFSDPDFNYRSLLGNAVLRWEYRTGSTLYLVWQQQRTDVVPIGGFDFQRDYRALVDHTPQNVFAVKVTWWIGV